MIKLSFMINLEFLFETSVELSGHQLSVHPHEKNGIEVFKNLATYRSGKEFCWLIKIIMQNARA